jgi:DNA-binding GntR family transcriptional regulator
MEIDSVVDRTKQYLEERIITGELFPGQQIKEEEIASRLEISRPPIREAFKILETEGLITKKPRCGVFVSEIREKDIWEIYTLKVALYGLATSLAIDNITEEGIGRLENVIQLMGKCVEKEPPDLIEYQDLNETFHLMMTGIAGHGRLKRITATLNNQIKRFSYKSLGEKEHLLSSYQNHKRILGAIRNRDKELAEKITREHILNGMKVLQKIFATQIQK